MSWGRKRRSGTPKQCIHSCRSDRALGMDSLDEAIAWRTVMQTVGPLWLVGIRGCTCPGLDWIRARNEATIEIEGAEKNRVTTT